MEHESSTIRSIRNFAPTFLVFTRRQSPEVAAPARLDVWVAFPYAATSLDAVSDKAVSKNSCPEKSLFCITVEVDQHKLADPIVLIELKTLFRTIEVWYRGINYPVPKTLADALNEVNILTNKLG